MQIIITKYVDDLLKIIQSLMADSTVVVCQTALVVKFNSLAKVTHSQSECTDLVLQ